MTGEYEALEEIADAFPPLFGDGKPEDKSPKRRVAGAKNFARIQSHAVRRMRVRNTDRPGAA